MATPSAMSSEFAKAAMLVTDPKAGFAHAMKLLNTLNMMDDSVKNYILAQVKEAEAELHLQIAASRQLEAEMQADILRNHKSGTGDSLLFQRLPPEIRAHIFSYVVIADKSVHVFPPKGNEAHGYRLSLCDETNYDFELGHCRCDDSRTRGGNITSTFFHNAIFLVSRDVRREALDSFFLVNNFTFTCLYELVRFTYSFRASSSKIQNIRLFERVDDYPNSDFRVKGIQKARLRLKALKHLEIYVFLSSWSAYETLHEDGLINQLLHFALGPSPPNLSVVTQQGQKRKICATAEDEAIVASTSKVPKVDGAVDGGIKSESTVRLPSAIDTIPPLPLTLRKELFDMSGQDLDEKPSTITTNQDPINDRLLPVSSPPPFPIPALRSFKANVRLRNLALSLRGRPESGRAEYYASLYTRLTDHLNDVFLDNGKKYRTLEDVPSLGPKPKLKVRDDERALTGIEKRGILYLKD